MAWLTSGIKLPHSWRQMGRLVQGREFCPGNCAQVGGRGLSVAWARREGNRTLTAFINRWIRVPLRLKDFSPHGLHLSVYLSLQLGNGHATYLVWCHKKQNKGIGSRQRRRIQEPVSQPDGQSPASSSCFLHPGVPPLGAGFPSTIWVPAAA